MKILPNKTYLLCALAASTFSHSAIAEKEEIIVTAKGQQTISDVISTTHVFNEDDIVAAQVKELPALLDRLAGISVRDSGGRGSATGFFIRGTSSSQNIVLIDGVRVGSATLGSAALNAIPIEAIERIEVLKGPFSGLYGADAVGGVIQIFTKKHAENLGTIQVSLGSNSLKESSLSFNGGNAKHSFTFSAFAEESNGIDRTSITTGGNDDIDGFEETAFHLAGKTTLARNTIAELSVLYSDNEVEFDNTSGADPGSKTETESLNAALNISSQLTAKTQWISKIGFFEEDADTTSSFSSAFTTQRTSFNTEVNHQINQNHTLTAGFDYYEEDIEASSTFPVTERDNRGVFAQLQSQLGHIDFVGSVRYDDNSAYGSETNGSAAIAFSLAHSLRLSASYGTAFVAPSFNFLYFPSFGNPDLLPEESDSYEISLMGNHKNIDWRISAYKTDVENLFSVNPSTFLAANIGEAELEGIEAHIDTSLLGWDLGINLDLLSAENKDTGVELDDRAETTLQISLSKDFDKLTLGFDFKFEEDRFDRAGTRLPSYALFDISAQYHINQQLSVLANIDNIFDKDYTVNLINSRERFNTEGRQAKLTVRYQF